MLNSALENPVATAIGLGLFVVLATVVVAAGKRFAESSSAAIGAFLVLASLMFAYFPAAGAMFPIHDYLDGEHVLLALRGDNPQFFNLNGEMSTVMGGVPLSALGISDLNLLANLYVFLDSASAASAIEVGVRLAGYFGAYTLLRRFVITTEKWRSSIAAAFAFAFALAPYWPNLSATIALQAPFFAGLLSIRAGNRALWAYAAVLAYPLVTDFARGGFAVAAVVLAIILLDAANGRKSALRRLRDPLAGSGILLMLALARPLHIALVSDFVSHRSEWRLPERIVGNTGSTQRFLDAFVELVENGYYHFASGQKPVVLLTVLVAGPVALQSYFLLTKSLVDKADSRIGAAKKYLLAGVLVLSVSAAAASEMSGLTAIGSRLPIPVQLARFYALLPLAWTVLGAAAVTVLVQQSRKRPSTLLIAVLLLLVPASALAQNHAVVARAVSAIHGVNRPEVFGWQLSTIDAYYQQEAYNFLVHLTESSTSQVTVLSFGIDPMKAAYSGLNTLDGYHYNYRLQHKRSFRGVIADELLRTGTSDYFDTWGNRAYLSFSPESSASVLDYCAASDLGGTHLLSEEFLHDQRLELLDEAGGLLTYVILSDSCDDPR